MSRIVVIEDDRLMRTLLIEWLSAEGYQVDGIERVPAGTYNPADLVIIDVYMGEIKVADVRAQVALSLFTDFENFSTFKPGPHQAAAVNAMLDDLVPWGRALQAMRSAKEAAQRQKVPA